MKNKITNLLLSAVLFMAGSAFGQTILTNTTLSAAITSSSSTTAVVTSATNINAPSTSDATKATYIFVDRELMDVRAVNGTTLSVVRGAGGTAASTHASSAFVFVVPAYLSTQFAIVPAGSCTRANEVALPRVNARTGIISDCNGGQWVNGGITQTTFVAGGAINDPPTAGTAYTSLESNGTAFDAVTSMYCNEIKLPYSKVLTGLKVLMGTTAGGSEKKAVLLYDAGGKLLANSAAAGQTMGSTASVFVSVAFSTPFYAVGPGRYFGCIQSNGTSDTIRHTITAVNDNYLNSKVTGQTFGTFAASITAPSTFTTAIGPYFQLY